MHFDKNDRIGPYTVKFRHKQGAYAETYRVQDKHGKTLFLKLINYAKLSRHQMDDEGRVIEVQIARQLNHKNLCQYVDSGKLVIDGSPYEYFVTEYVSGETLSQHVSHQDDISVYDIKQVAHATLQALSFLHSRPVPIIHNEVTIQNLMLDLTGRLDDLRLIDFGFARFLNQRPAKPDLDTINPFYLAPERFSGVCSVQTDIYATGAVLYQLLYGQLPWYVDLSTTSAEDRIDAILTERDNELELPTVEKFELDDQFVNTIAKSLSQDPEDRFRSADEFIQAIDGSLQVPRQSTRRKILSDSDKGTAAQPKPTKKKGTGFAAIAGMKALKQKMQEDVIDPLNHPEAYRRYGITIPNGMLLYGPPGCGKTFFAKQFAEEVGFNFLCTSGAELKSRWVNATQENIVQMFKDAEEKAPTIIFIDEFNELVPNRESNVHEMSRSAVNAMLAQMDRTGEKGVFVVGATNFPTMIDPAILRAGRIDQKYYIGVPDDEARREIFRLYLAPRPYDFGIDYDQLSTLTANYVSADIRLIVDNASRMAMRDHSKITMQLLTKAIHDTRPSITRAELARYEAMHNEMEGRATAAKPRPRIGFN